MGEQSTRLEQELGRLAQKRAREVDDHLFGEDTSQMHAACYERSGERRSGERRSDRRDGSFSQSFAARRWGRFE